MCFQCERIVESFQNHVLIKLFPVISITHFLKLCYLNKFNFIKTTFNAINFNFYNLKLYVHFHIQELL